MTLREDQDSKSVFLNIPYDRQYEPFFVTLVSSLVSLGQKPRCVLEVRERGQGRLMRIFELLGSCRVSIHDLRRSGRPVRFNMPFELGIACALGLAGMHHDVIVMDTVRYRLDRTLSDYKGRDPLIYRGFDGLVDGIADVFQVRHEPSAAVLKEEARLLRRLARDIAQAHGGTVFRPRAFRTLVAAATTSATRRGLISS